MDNGGLLDYILGNTKAKQLAENEYIKKLEKDIQKLRMDELRRNLLGESFNFPRPLGG